jgi:tetratricopeptide (TPR) repeat protein/DNA-binding NarL/FixJ family response regulator
MNKASLPHCYHWKIKSNTNECMHYLFIFYLLVAPLTLLSQTARLDSIKNEIVRAQSKQDRYAEAQNLSYLAREQAEQGFAMDAVDNAKLSIALFENLGKKSEAYHAYVPLLAIHHQLHNPEKIIEYARPVLEFAKTERDTPLWTQMLTAMGIGYDELNQYDQSIACYLACIRLDEARGRQDPTNYANASSTFSYMHRYVEAIQYARQSIEISTKQEDTVSLTLGWLNLAYAHMNNGQAAEATEAINQAEALARTLGYVNLDRDIMEIRARTAALRQDYRTAYQLFQQYHSMDSTMSSADRNAEFATLEAVYQNQKKQMENARLDAQLQQQRWWLWGSLAAVVLLCFAFWQQYRRRLAQAQLLVVEQQLAQQERQQIEAEKAYLSNSLMEQTRLLIEKNNAIEALRKELEQTLQTGASSDKVEELNQLCQNAILTEADWRHFCQKFERVYPGFFEQFDNIAKDASEADRRLAALLKLGLNNLEIASMLGISVDSVYKSRYRFKKKLGDVVDMKQFMRQQGG